MQFCCFFYREKTGHITQFSCYGLQNLPFNVCSIGWNLIFGENCALVDYYAAKSGNFCLTTQKSTVLICFAVEASNRA
jgi:hypothetical protein